MIAYFPNNFADIEYLNSGDVMGVGNGPNGGIVWGVEIKKLGDVLDSMQTGRLAEQLGKMQEDYDARFLLVEGDFRSADNGTLQQRKRRYVSGKWVEYWSDVMFGNKKKITYPHFMSWLLSVTICSNTFYLHTTSRQETADTVVALDRLFTKDWDGHGSLNVFHDGAPPPGLLIPTIPMEVVRKMADGVGWEKAVNAAAHFKTVRAMSNATVEQWREVDGIDKVLAERLVAGATVPHATKRRTRRKK